MELIDHPFADKMASPPFCSFVDRPLVNFLDYRAAATRGQTTFKKENASISERNQIVIADRIPADHQIEAIEDAISTISHFFVFLSDF